MFLVRAVSERYYHENLSSNVIKESADMALIPLSLPAWCNCPSGLKPDLVSVCASISSICSHHSLLCPSTPPRVSSSPSLSYFSPSPLFNSLHLHHSLYVQGTFTTRDRGQAPLQEELRDSHHERRESCESGLHIAARKGASSRVGGLILTEGKGP